MVLSTLAFIVSGFAAYQMFGLRQAIKSLNSQASNPAVAPTPAPATDSSPAQDTVIVPSPAQTSLGNSATQPGQFVQNAYGTKARVELLSVKWIQDPEVGTRDVVNVQMRIRRVAEDVSGSNLTNLGEVSAPNPDTSQTYEPVDFLKRSSGVVSLFSMRWGGLR